MDNCGSYARLVPLLLPYASFMCIDLPGHGRSSHLPPGTVYQDLDYVRTVKRIMVAYEWKKVSLLAHSMGGSVAFHFACLNPEKVDMIISIESIKKIYFEPKVLIPYLVEVVDCALKYNEPPQKDPPCYTVEQVINAYRKATKNSVHPEYCWHILERNLTKSPINAQLYYFSRDQRIRKMVLVNADDQLAEELVNRIIDAKIPYMVLYGGDSQNFQQYSEYISNVLKKRHNMFETYTIPGGTHHVHLNDPEKCAEYIIPFLQKYRSMDKIKNEKNCDNHAKL